MLRLTIILLLLPAGLLAQNRVGVHTTNPQANLHVRGSSSIGFPNLRITDTIDNFARIKMESEIAPGRFWDIAASSTEGSTHFNLFFQNDTTAQNLLSIRDNGWTLRKSLNQTLQTFYYTWNNNYRGHIGFEGPVLQLNAVDSDGHIEFKKGNVTHVTLDGKTIGVHGTGRSVFVGSGAGANDNETLNRNTAVGDSAMYASVNGALNVAVGLSALRNNSDGHFNIALGSNALYSNANGQSNVALGYGAGEFANGLSYNVFLGYRAGRNATSSNRLYIDNSSTSSPLIYGEFDNDLVRINGTQKLTGELDIEKTGVGMRVNGDEAIWYDGTYFSWGFGATHNYFQDGLKIGGAGSSAPISDIHISQSGDASMTLESTLGGSDAFIQFTDDASQGPAHQWTVRRDDSDGGKLQWRHSNFHKMTLTTSGKLGLGSTMNNPAYLLQLSANDAAKPGSSSWTISSDKRLKQDVQTYNDGLEQVLRIRPVTYRYNSKSAYDTSTEYVGIIAQELQAIAPYMVSENDQGYLDVDDAAMTFMLINAVQEQQEIIDAQNDRIEKLERVITEISATLDKRD